MFSFYSYNWQKLQFTFQKLEFSTFITFLLHSWNSMDINYFFSLCGRRNEAVFLIVECSSPSGVKRKTTRKIMFDKFWFLSIYYKRFDLKTWLSERFPEALPPKLWNKKIICSRSLQNEENINYVQPPVVLPKIFDRSI